MDVGIVVDCSSENAIWNPSTAIDLVVSPSSVIEIIDFSSDFTNSNSLCGHIVELTENV